MPEVNMERYITKGEADTRDFAAAIAAMLNVGDVVLLHGDLGTGKSVFARGVARAFGITGAMPSPTFTLLIPYEGSKKLYHFDLYRLNDPEEFYEAGLHEFVGGDGIALIEWPEMAELEAERALEVTLERGAGEEERVITLENRGLARFDADSLERWRVRA